MKNKLFLTLLLLATLTTSIPSNAAPSTHKVLKESKNKKTNLHFKKGETGKIGAGSPVFLNEEDVKEYVAETSSYRKERIAEKRKTKSFSKGEEFKIEESFDSYVTFCQDEQKYYIANTDFLVSKRGPKLLKIYQGRKKAPGKFAQGSRIRIKDSLVAFRYQSDAQTYSRLLFDKKIEEAEGFVLNRMKEDQAIQLTPHTTLLVEGISVLADWVRRKESLSVFDESDWAEDCTDVTINGENEDYSVNTAELYSVRK